jgi:hypothetical protein
MTRLRKWAEITREERFFASELFQEIKVDPEPFLSQFRAELQLSAKKTVQDTCYEVCIARDLWHAKLLEKRCKPLEKQTIDIVLTLTGNDLLLIEVKAHQGFGSAQIETMEKLEEHLRNFYPSVGKIYLGGLHSSKYTPRNIRMHFPSFAMCTWKSLLPHYPHISSQIRRADEIYRN